MILLATTKLAWVWSIFAITILTIIVFAIIFGAMFEDTDIWDGWASKVKCDHTWEKRDDLSSYRTRVVVCKHCGKIKKLRV